MGKEQYYNYYGSDTYNDCDEYLEDCVCDDDYDDDEFNQENIIDTFRPMNAFARARWLKANKKLQELHNLKGQ